MNKVNETALHTRNNEPLIINNDLIFSPTTRELKSMNSGARLVLQTPASRILMLLLEKPGETFVRDELVIYAWNAKTADIVSNNAYYQIVSYLRKKMSDMGYPNMIVTVPKKGLSLDGTISVTRSETRTVTDNSLPAVQDVLCQTYAQVQMRAGMENTAQEVQPTNQAKTPPRKIGYYAMSVSLTVVFFLSSFLLASTRNSAYAFDFYQKENYQQCVIYKSDGVDEAIRDHLLKINGIACDDRQKSLFITANRKTFRSSVIVCDELSARKQSCYTATNMESNGNG